MVKIRVPATSANLGSGFDALGIALTLYNTVEMEECDGVRIVSADNAPIPLDEENMVFAAAKRMYEICGVPFHGLSITQRSDIPMTRGLGSSSACLVAGLLGANQLLGQPLKQRDIINLAAAMEGHPDNTTPTILGGLVTCAVEEGAVYSVSVPVSPRFRFVAMVPPAPLSTEKARALLPDTVTRRDAVFNLSRAALMASSLFSGQTENLLVATEDRLHQPYRMALIPGADAAFRVARELGAYGVCISGSGSAILAIIDGENRAFMEQLPYRLGVSGIFDWKLLELQCDGTGATVENTGRSGGIDIFSASSQRRTR